MGFLRDGPLIAYRIADRRFPILNGVGAARNGGRWNSVGAEVIYAACSYAGAILERRVHCGPKIPQDQVYAEITIPAHVQLEVVEPTDLPDNWVDDPNVTRDFGDRWVRESRSVALLVPSAVAGNFHEQNVIINPQHGDFRLVEVGPAGPVTFDRRLFDIEN